MNTWKINRCATLLGLACMCGEPLWAQSFYTQIGSDPTWAQLLSDRAFPIGVNSAGGVLGSRIDVDNAAVEKGANANRKIAQGINIHTLCNSSIQRTDFPKWTRWYQEDGNTQVFRLFPGEYNVRNDRPEAARIEAFSDVTWTKGAWHEWIGTFTIIKPHGCAIFQVKNSINDWGIMLNMNDNGDIIANHRRDQADKTIATNMLGKSFDIKARDNGHDYEIYLNGAKVASGSYARPTGTTAFRWGMYDHTIQHDALMFVTGATVDPGTTRLGSARFASTGPEAMLSVVSAPGTNRIFNLSLTGGWEAYSLRGERVNRGPGTVMDMRAFPAGPYWVRVGKARAGLMLR